MAIIENIINVLVPLLICGLIFIYFRRKITNLEQSIDIIMKMLQTNQLTNSDSTNESVFVPNDNNDTRTVELNNVNLEENEIVDNSNNSESESDDESNTEDSDSESESDSETESSSHTSEKPDNNELPSTDNNSTEETGGVSNIEHLLSNVEETKTVLLTDEPSKEELEKKTLSDLKKLLKTKVPDINNLSRMNKATVIENLMN